MVSFKTSIFSAFVGCVLLLASCGVRTEPSRSAARKGVDYSWGKENSEIIAPTFNNENYKGSQTRTHDLLHTALDLDVDWAKRSVYGSAQLTLTPYFYETDQLHLDAKGFVINSIQLITNESKTPLKYTYEDQTNLYIDLDKTYQKGEVYKIEIEYAAFPEKRRAIYFGKAIASDKGLYFIDPEDTDPEKPTQLWTQGEPESSSVWFPTIDQPNERCTQELTITVENKYKTLSNGLLKSSSKNSDGTRTDYWDMDLPHAPYLFMLAVGDFAIVKDKWKDIELYYYVEPKYEPYAKDVFSNTPEMMTFFEDKLNVEFPWQKYAQVIVRDYVSGAMENTTAVVFQESFQKTERELIDNHNERIIAHELFHHWFGDLVTCESWANIAMNEAFANYSEYLWFEHEYGIDEAEKHRHSEIQGYLSDAQNNLHPLIHYGYENKDDMFDAHSYNKGGAILHMLRHEIGEEAMWRSMEKYLKDNAYSDVEADEFRLAVEDVTGRDMNWFFDQWFYSQGHPILEVTHDISTKSVEIHVNQLQDASTNPEVFTLPLAVDIHYDDYISREYILLNQRSQTIPILTKKKAKFVDVDPENLIVGEVYEDRELDDFAYEFNNSSNFIGKKRALMNLLNFEYSGIEPIINTAMNDEHWDIRRIGVQSVTKDDPVQIQKLKEMAISDKHSKVRAAAIYSLARLTPKETINIATNAIENDLAYPVIAAGLSHLYVSDINKAKQKSKQLENTDKSDILAVLGDIYFESADVSKLSFYEKNFKNIKGSDAFNFFESYAALTQYTSLEVQRDGHAKIYEVGSNMTYTPYQRFAATRALSELKKVTKVKIRSEKDESIKKELEADYKALSEMIENIKKVEKLKQLIEYYESY